MAFSEKLIFNMKKEVAICWTRPNWNSNPKQNLWFMTIEWINQNYRWRLESCTAVKVQIFWEGYKVLRNLHQLFVRCSASQIVGGDFSKFCGLLKYMNFTYVPKCGKFDLQFWIEAGGAYNRYVMYLCQYQIFKARYLG